MNKISIITVVKNGIPFIKDSINSFLLQKYPNKELIIILAKSDDGTDDYIKRSFGNYKEIKIFNEKKSIKNKFGALNQGLKLCSGEIIGILHSDDIYYSEHILDEVSKVFLNGKVNFLYSDIIKKEIRQTEIKLTKYEENDDYCICDDNDEDSNISRTKEESINLLIDEKCKLQLDFDKLSEDIDTIVKQSEEMAKKIIIDQRLDKLKNSFIIENTPLGNVLMIFDKELETFKYYSDNTIPYRYLETVGRKYAKQFCCRPIFVDMEEELKIADIKWEKEKEDRIKKEEDDRIKKEEAIKNNITIEEKKNVFTKFKSYNKDAGTGHINVGAPPKNSISNKQLTEKQEQEKILLKEKANRYTYEGKFANFSFLKKVDRKLVDKKFAMTFANFKKMQMGQKCE